MARKAISRKRKAFTLVPLALLSAAWTASLASADTAVSAPKTGNSALPDGSAVPSKAIKAPASVPVPGSIAPSVPDGTADQVVASASTNGIPTAALSAYQRGAQIIDATSSSCNVPWELLAAIGRVESNHGQYGGNTLTADGVSKPGIFGPVLNGKNGTTLIQDTDGGEIDGDAVYDRAVGPMQFIPSTWSVVKVDANGDGKRNPQDINDAALAAGVYLCSGNQDLSTRNGQETAVYRYNHSRAYVDLVLRIMEAYSQGDYSAIPSGTYGGSMFSPNSAAAIRHKRAEAKQHPLKTTSTSTGSTSSSTGSSSSTTSPSTPGGNTSGSGNTSSDPLAPLTKGLQDATNGLTNGPNPVTDTLASLTAATTFCKGQLNAINDPLGLLTTAVTNLCGKKVQGMNQTDAAAVIPNTVPALLSWLGL